MPKLLAAAALAVLTCLIACHSETSDSAPVPPSETTTGAPASTDAPPVTTVPLSPAEPDFVWVPPVLPDHSPACEQGGNPSARDYTTAGNRTFHVFKPSGYDASKRWPVLFMFHGWKTEGMPFESWFKMESYVNGEAIVVYPDAQNQLWDLSGDSDLTFFDDMVKQVGETYCVDPQHVYAFGFSYGARFTNHLVCQRAGYVRAASLGDGGDGGDYKKCGRTPMLFTHRTHDNDEKIEWSRANAAHWAELDKCSPDTVPVDTDMNCVQNTGCADPATLEFCEDTWFDPQWPEDWNHTVREPYRAFTWKWLKNH